MKDCAGEWGPEVETDRTVAEVDTAFDALWTEILRQGLASRAMPPADVHESPAAYELTLELPGVQRADIEVRVDAGRLTIRGRKRSPEIRPGRLAERRFGRFERTFVVPDDIDNGAVDVRLADGVLSVVLPRTASPA